MTSNDGEYHFSQRQILNRSASVHGHDTDTWSILITDDEPERLGGRKVNALKLHGCAMQPLKCTNSMDWVGTFSLVCTRIRKKSTVTTRAWHRQFLQIDHCVILWGFLLQQMLMGMCKKWYGHITVIKCEQIIIASAETKTLHMLAKTLAYCVLVYV